ncbi:uncharacterized protein [Henckelia pumila]|uniref:uncharacterized protein n=1 Tax=Henckelia pumila TaxID=405737 RepID=UPI003C6E7480
MVNRMGSVLQASRGLERWFEGNGGLSKAYDFFLQTRGIWPWKPLVWKSCIIPKHRVILWLLAHGKLLTRDRLGFVEDKKCGLCKDCDESIGHMFFQCRVVCGVWDCIRDWLNMKKLMKSPSAILKAFRGVYRGAGKLPNMRAMGLAACVYQVWNARNRAYFDNEDSDVDDMVRRIKILVLRNMYSKHDSIPIGFC